VAYLTEYLGVGEAREVQLNCFALNKIAIFAPVGGAELINHVSGVINLN